MRSRADLHDYQVTAYRHFMDNPRSAGFLDLGLGKTAITLTVLSDVLQDLDAGQALVIAPIRVAKATWPAEIQEWEHTAWLEHTLIRAEDQDADVKAVFDKYRQRFLNGATVLGVPPQHRSKLATTFASEYRDRYKKRKRARLALTKTPLHIIGLPQVEWLVKFHGKRWPYRTVVIDESSAFKEMDTARWRAMNSVFRYIDRMHLLTASPAAESWMSLWAQVGLLDRGERLGRKITHYREAYFDYDPYERSYTLKHSAREKISEAISDICLVMKAEDHLDLAAPNFITRHIELPDELVAKYDEFVSTSILSFGEAEIEAVNGAVLINKLIQFTGGAVLDEERQVHEVHDEKIEELAELIDELDGEPLIIAYWYQSSLRRLRKRFPKAVVMDKGGKAIDAWNRGEIDIMLLHPACLHPATKVLTEHRGWVNIVDVKRTERVHDGVEFVGHSGCQFSGMKPVIDVFGVKMTADHRLLIGDRWVEACDVRDSGTTSREASHPWRRFAEGAAGTMLDVFGRADFGEADGAAGQSGKPQALSDMLSGGRSPNDRYAVSQHLAGNARASDKSGSSGVPPLRWCRSGYIRRLARLSELLSGYARQLCRRFDDRQGRQRFRLLQRKLRVDHDVRPAVAQDRHALHSISGRDYAPERVLSSSRRFSWRYNGSSQSGYDGRRSRRGLCGVDVSTQPEISEVYDLVDCGPRNRFLIRNDVGEVFVSHNSAGHGLNLQYGGHDIAFFDPVWSREYRDQTIGRLARQGQKKVVRVHDLIVRRKPDPKWTRRQREDAMTADEIVMQALAEKGEGQAALFRYIRQMRDRARAKADDVQAGATDDDL